MSYYNYETVTLTPAGIVSRMKRLDFAHMTLQKTLVTALGACCYWEGESDPEDCVHASVQFSRFLPDVLPCSLFAESNVENIDHLLEVWKGIDKVRVTYTMKIENQQTQWVILDGIVRE